MTVHVPCPPAMRPSDRTAHKGRAYAEGFKDFAMKGNVVDLAVGVIIGLAFGKIVESMVGDIIVPLIGLAGNFDFSNLYLSIGKVPDGTSYVDAKKIGAAIGYGQFLTYIVNFMIVAAVLFLVVQGHEHPQEGRGRSPCPARGPPGGGCPARRNPRPPEKDVT